MELKDSANTPAMPFTACHLAERAVLSVSGPEAQSFLHTLVTADVTDGARLAYAGLLTPQGKLQFDFFIAREAERFLIDCAASQRDGLLKRLALYKLRARVVIAPAPELKVSVSPDTGIADPRWDGMGFRSIGPEAPHGASASYHAHRIASGIADTDQDLASGDFFAHEANLDQLNAVSFSKGCYVGQEIVARMEHRGTARSRILPVALDGAAPAHGTALTAGGKAIGTLLSSSGRLALAVVRLDKLQDALSAGDAVSAEGRTATIMTPAWARFHVPQPRTA